MKKETKNQENNENNELGNIDDEFEQFKDDVLYHEEKASVDDEVNEDLNNEDEKYDKTNDVNNDNNNVDIDNENEIKENDLNDNKDNNDEDMAENIEKDCIEENNNNNDNVNNNNEIGINCNMNTDGNEQDEKYLINPNEDVNYVIEDKSKNKSTSKGIDDNKPKEKNTKEIKEVDNFGEDKVNEAKEYFSDSNVDIHAMTSKNTMLENQLRFICDKIEEAIHQYRNSKQIDSERQQKETKNVINKYYCFYILKLQTKES